MQTEITRGSKFRQEVWTFYFYTGTPNRIYLDYYALQNKIGKQRNWRSELWWGRIDKRYNNLKENPPLPDDVIEEAKQYFADQIKELIITI